MVNSYFQDEPFVESEIIVYDGEDRGTGETHYREIGIKVKEKS